MEELEWEPNKVETKRDPLRLLCLDRHCYRGPTLEVQLEILSMQVGVLKEAIELLVNRVDVPDRTRKAVLCMLLSGEKREMAAIEEDKKKQGF